MIKHQEYEYLNSLKTILEKGKLYNDRTGVGRISYFGMQMRFNLENDFPALTTKTLAWKSIVSELLWFLEGSSDERRLAQILRGNNDFDINDRKTHTIWTLNAIDPKWVARANELNLPKLSLGNVYGVQWRSWPTNKKNNDGSIQTIDQIKEVIKSIKENPHSTRHIVSAWNVGELENMALPPCHTLFQFYVQDGKLSCHLFQRSADFFLGVPFNIASYSLLIHMMALETGLKPGEFLHSITDAHIYSNHVEQVKEQLTREPFNFPTLKINQKNSIFDYNLEDFVLENYKHHPTITAPMAQ